MLRNERKTLVRNCSDSRFHGEPGSAGRSEWWTTQADTDAERATRAVASRSRSWGLARPTDHAQLEWSLNDEPDPQLHLAGWNEFRVH